MTTQKELKDEVAQAVENAMRKYSDKFTMPRTIYEFIWQGAQTFGIPAVAFGVVLLIVYQTFPAWVSANIETQNSLTTNLAIQTENLISLGSTLDNLQEFGPVAVAEFRKDVQEEHRKMAIEVHEIKIVTDTLCEEQVRQREEHKAIVGALKLLCDELKRGDK